jgi:hypothetical protein
MTTGNALFLGPFPKPPFLFRPAFPGRFLHGSRPPLRIFYTQRTVGCPCGLFLRPTVVLYHLTYWAVKSFRERSPTFSLFSAKIWEKCHIYSLIFIIFNHFSKK